MCKDSLFSTSLPTPATSYLFNNSHSDSCEVIRHCGFDLHLPITADGDCSLLLGHNFHSNLDSIFKSRDNTLPTEVRLVKAMDFPVVMCGGEIWTVKKAER